MAITVKDIHEKEFTRQVRGYSIDEVDEFLDEIAQQMEMLIRENRALNQKLAEAPAGEAAQAASAPAAPVPAVEAAPVAAPKDDSSYFRNLETTLRDTLVSAQRVAEDTMSEAQKKADALVSSAQEEAAKIVGDAKAEGAKLESENNQLRAAAANYRDSFLRLVREQMATLKADETLFG